MGGHGRGANRAVLLALGCLSLAACNTARQDRTFETGLGVASTAGPAEPAETSLAAGTPEPAAKQAALPHGRGPMLLGKAYQMAGRWFTPKHDPDYSEVGLASWYGGSFHGRTTANGETFDQYALSAAHPTLPLPSYVRVTNLENQRSVVVRVNDRGPYSHRRLIDVSASTADLLDFRRAGMAEVQVDYVQPAPREDEDDTLLLATYRGPEAPTGFTTTRRLALVEAPPPAPRPAVIAATVPANAVEPAFDPGRFLQTSDSTESSALWSFAGSAAW